MFKRQELVEAIKVRHSVRQYTDSPIDVNKIGRLNRIIKKCNEEGNLNIQLVINDPDAFNCMRARYGKFENVNNYIALIGKEQDKLEKKIGYYGELIVLAAVSMGLGTCWVGGTFSKKKSRVQATGDEKFVCGIAIGNHTSTGTPHKSKPLKKLFTVEGSAPDWFKDGMNAVMLAPTAMNQQKFHIYYDGEKITTKAYRALFSKLDLGITKRHFELAANVLVDDEGNVTHNEKETEY